MYLEVDSKVGDSRRSVEVLGKHIHVADPTGAAQGVEDFLFTCADLDFKTLVEAWIPLRRKGSSACNLLFGLKYMPNTYTELKALTLAIAAESMHGSVGEKSVKPFSPQEFGELKTVLRQALKDKGVWRGWVCEKLRNQPTYHQRVADLAATPSQDAVNWIIPDQDAWITDLKKVRNGMAHGRGPGVDVEDLFGVAESTSSLLYLYLMERLGLGPEVQVRAAKKNWYLGEKRRTFLLKQQEAAKDSNSRRAAP